MILSTGILLMVTNGCASTDRIGEITKPHCPDDSIRKLCVSLNSDGVYFADDVGGCQDWLVYYGVAIEKNCFRELDKYWLKLEVGR